MILRQKWTIELCVEAGDQEQTDIELYVEAGEQAGIFPTWRRAPPAHLENHSGKTTQQNFLRGKSKRHCKFEGIKRKTIVRRIK